MTVPTAVTHLSFGKLIVETGLHASPSDQALK